METLILAQKCHITKEEARKKGDAPPTGTPSGMTCCLEEEESLLLRREAMPSCQECGATSFSNVLGEGNWGTSVEHGTVTVSAAQQGVNVPARPSAEGREAPQGRGAWSGVNTFILHLEDTAGLPPGSQRRISLGTWQQ